MEEDERKQLQLLHTTTSAEPVLTSEYSNSMTSATLGRVMNTLLTSKPKKLLETISRLDPSPKVAPIGVSLEQSLWFLYNYVKDADENKESSLDQVLLPMIQHSLRFRGSKHGNQVMILLNWLFEDEISFQALANELVAILSRKEDRYIILGWCTLARSLTEFKFTMDKLVTRGVGARCDALLKIFCTCMSHLVAIVRDGSTVQGGFELPTRLSVAAADLILSLTEALTRADSVSNCSDGKQKAAGTSEKAAVIGEKNCPVNLLPSTSTKKKVNKISKSSQFTDMEMKLLLWDHLEHLVILVQRLTAWSRKSRPLHSKALERVHRWLLGTQKNYIHIQTKTDSEMLKSGVLLLSSCWKHYATLLHLEDHKFTQQYTELLEQYLSGIQFYADNYAEESPRNKESGRETIKFFLNCLALLLGRLHGKQFETAIEEYGSRLSQAIISQLNCADDELINSALGIFKAVIFRTNSSLSKCAADIRQINALLPMLLHLLDEQDSAAKAVIKLFAEYCSISSDTQCFEEILKHLTSGNVAQKRNAVDFIADLVHISMGSDTVLPPPMWQHLSCHLLEFLQDEHMVISRQASNLIPLIEPSLTLPALVCLIYSPLERVQSLASGTLTALLKNYKHNPDVICMLLDCLSKPSQNPDVCDTADGVEGPKPDIDRVLKLLPEWSKMVEDWKVMIGPLIDKLFAEPSNAVIVRFLSFISEHLANAADFVFQQLISYTRRQRDSDDGAYPNNNASEQQLDLFNRLCPLLIVRLLPLRVFNDLNAHALYDELPTKLAAHDDECLGSQSTECVAGLLINRSLSKFEFEDVRRLAAELCGRIHPKVLIPIMSYQLKNATNAKDLLKIKACLFSICTSLLVRGTDAYVHPDIFQIRKAIETILLWPSVDGDDISKAQHGCIDCLALMLCTELRSTKAFKNSTLGDSVAGGSVCNYVIHHLVCDEDGIISLMFGTNEMEKAHLSFRLCMANVLISACQKVPRGCKKPFVSEILPHLLHSVKEIADSEVRSACIQVFFSMVYHLKSLVLPYCSDLLKASIESLRKGSEKERIAGAKLLASLMASEEAVLQDISGGLLEARALLRDICSKDPSLDIRNMCQRLLVCLTSV